MTRRQDALLRGLTLCASTLFLGLGLWLMLQPQEVQDLYPMSLNAPMAVSEIRAIFGGMMAGIGASALLLDFVCKRQRDAAMVLATITGAMVLARIIGLNVEGFPSGPALTESIFEMVLFALLVSLGAYRAPV